MKGYFITGTDTGIGKTCISAGLTQVCVQAGYQTAAIKSLAAGQDYVDGRWVNEDVVALPSSGAVRQLAPPARRTLLPGWRAWRFHARICWLRSARLANALMFASSKASVVFVCPWLPVGTRQTWRWICICRWCSWWACA